MKDKVVTENPVAITKAAQHFSFRLGAAHESDLTADGFLLSKSI